MNRHSFLIFFVLIGFCACKDYPSEPINDWTHLNDFPGVARASASSFVVGDKAYICFGRSAWKGDFLKEIWEYNSLTDTWIRKTDFPGSARVKAVAGVIGTKAYIGMGATAAYDESAIFNDFWEYDTQKDTWTQKTSFPGKGKNDLFCTVVNDTLYVTMGFTGYTRSEETWKYDPLTDIWSQLPNCPYNASNIAGFHIGNSFYVGTGFRGYNMKVFYQFRTDIRKWVKKSDLPHSRMLSNGLTVKDKGYMLLGRYWNGSLNGGGLLSDILEYDPAADTWTKRGDFPGGARQNAVVFSIGEKGYIVMGEDDTERKSDVWTFRP
jgi:N-acetylneuraminic acid mutarotase